MSVPTTAELTLLRTHPHLTKPYLSIFQPEIVFSATVTGTIAKGEREVDYYDVTVGDAAFVNSGMTMLVGSSIGDESKGRIRVRSATGTASITVAENSHIDWANGDTLTVLDFYEINAVYPRIIQDPADDTKTLWYKDYDIAYAGQNSALGSFICMGSHYAGFTGDVFYSASGTYNLKGEALTYYWSFDVGASVTGSNANTPGNIYYDTPGHYTTMLTVSGTSAGAGNTSYRHISIYDRPEAGAGAHLPILSWELQDLSGSRDQGGYNASIRIHQDLSLVYSLGGEYKPIVREGDLVVIFAEDWYGTTKQSIGGNCLGRKSIVFVGYILKGTVQYNYRDSFVDFSVGSPTEIMKMAEGFSISVQDSADPSTATDNPDIPSNWVAILDMDIKRAIYHYMRWHTTVLNCCDVIFKGTDRPLQYFDSDRTSIYDAINTLIKGAWIGNTSCDRQGAIYCERDVYIEPSTFPTTFALNSKDWLDDINIEQARQEKTSFIELGGVAYTGASGTYTPLLSNAPGVSPGYRGKVVRQQGLALTSQAELNNIAGAMWRHHNLIYPNIDLKLAGNYRNFDIAPQEKIPLTVGLTDTVRGIVFTQKPFFVDRMQWQYDPKTEIFLPNVSLIELVTGSFAGDTVTIPDIPPTVGDGGGFYIPPIEFPVITIPPFPTMPGGAFDWSYIISSGITGSAIGTGIVGMMEVPYNCIITSVKVVSTIAGNITMDLWKCTYAQINPGTHPVATDSIVGVGVKPNLNVTYKNSVSLVMWTTVHLSAGNWLYINVESADLSLVTLSISGEVG